jgi:hypothetical protein
MRVGPLAPARGCKAACAPTLGTTSTHIGDSIPTVLACPLKGNHDNVQETGPVAGPENRKMTGFEWLWSYFTHTAHLGIKPPAYVF